MIKKIYKGKKNLLVLVTIESGFVQIEELNLKLDNDWSHKFTIQRYEFESYIQSKKLTEITFDELGQIIGSYFETVKKQIESLEKKFTDSMDVKKNVEVRHLLFEHTNDIDNVLLTEGLLKGYDCAQKHNSLVYKQREVNECIRVFSENEIKFKDVKNLSVPFFEDEQLNEVYSCFASDYKKEICRSIVKKGEYVFDNLIPDELPEDKGQEVVTPVVPSNDKTTV